MDEAMYIFLVGFNGVVKKPLPLSLCLVYISGLRS